MRLLLTFTILLAGSLAASYAVAPVPKEKKKTTTEKLIGEWQLAVLANGAVPAGKVTAEYKKNGKAFLSNAGAVKEAFFKVENYTIHYRMQHDSDKKWSATIKKITHDEMIVGNDQYGYSIYRRIAADNDK